MQVVSRVPGLKTGVINPSAHMDSQALYNILSLLSQTLSFGKQAINKKLSRSRTVLYAGMLTQECRGWAAAAHLICVTV